MKNSTLFDQQYPMQSTVPIASLSLSLALHQRLKLVLAAHMVACDLNYQGNAWVRYEQKNLFFLFCLSSVSLLCFVFNYCFIIYYYYY